MTDKFEGTVVLDGLVEGKVPDTADGEALLRDWVRFAASLGLRFNIELEGGSFSLLADRTPTPVESLGLRPADRVTEALTQLLKAFPADQALRVFSTVRSVEYQKGVEVQTVYIVKADRTVEVRERTVGAETAAAPRPLAPRQKWVAVLIGLGVALLVVAVSALFVDYRALLRSVVGSIMPYPVERLQVERGGFARYVEVLKKEVRRGPVVAVTLRRTAAFPRSEAECERRILELKPDALGERRILESLARGYLRTEEFDSRGRFIRVVVHRIADLHTSDTVDILLPLPDDRDLARVVLVSD